MKKEINTETENNYMEKMQQYGELFAESDILKKHLSDDNFRSEFVHVGVGCAKGDDKETKVVKQVLEDKLFVDALKKCNSVLVQVMGDISMLDFNDIVDSFQEVAGKEVLSCGGYAENMKDKVCVIAIAR